MCFGLFAAFIDGERFEEVEINTQSVPENHILLGAMRVGEVTMGPRKRRLDCKNQCKNINIFTLIFVEISSYSKTS